jgi:hypothetical protein
MACFRYISVNILHKGNSILQQQQQQQKQYMWNIKTCVIPVIIGATRTISKSFRKYLNNMPGKQGIK